MPLPLMNAVNEKRLSSVDERILQRHHIKRTLFACALTICLSLGCSGGEGPRLGAVTGKITMNGDPVPGLNVTFIPVGKGSPSYGGTDEKGVYRLMFNQQRNGAQLGKHNVVIENREPETDDSGNQILSGVVVAIPQKYSQPGTLSTEVRPGQNEVNFALDASDKP